MALAIPSFFVSTCIRIHLNICFYILEGLNNSFIPALSCERLCDLHADASPYVCMCARKSKAAIGCELPSKLCIMRDKSGQLRFQSRLHQHRPRGAHTSVKSDAHFELARHLTNNTHGIFQWGSWAKWKRNVLTPQVSLFTKSGSRGAEAEISRPRHSEHRQ